MRFQPNYVCHAPAQYRTDGHWPPPVAEVVPTAEEIAAWRQRWGATCSEKIATVLCALERDFATHAAHAPAEGC